MRRILTLAVLSLLAMPLALRAQDTGDPPLERGFRADAAFQLNDIDHVDLLRGTLAIVLPLGQSYSAGGAISYQFKLAYTSEVWDIWREDTCPLDPEPCPVDAAYPTKLTNAGFGWIFTLGMLHDTDDPDFPTTGWRYVSPDGAEHRFHDTLHDGETVNSNVMYTRDGSYMRMIYNSPYRWIEMPDGTRHKFEQYDVPNHKWRLVRVEDPFGNYISILYDTDGQGHPRWTVSDGTGRSHQVLFDATSKQVITVKLAAFGGTQAQYDLSYMSTQIHRSCLDLNPSTSEYVTVPLLVQIAQPDGSSYKMKEGTAPNEVPTYYLCCNDGNACSLGPDGGFAAPGAIRRLYLPTGGGLQWEYETYEIFWEEPFRCTFDVICPRPSSLRWAGVKTRKQITSSGAEVSGTTWQYDNVPNLAYSPSTDVPSHEYNPGFRPEERRMVVVAPDTNTTVHYFRAYPGRNTWIPPERERDYGLPYTRRIADPLGGDRYLSTQYFQGAVTFDANGDPQGGTLKRSVYRAYQLDQFLTGSSTGYRHANRHPISERTVHAESGGSHSVTVTSSDFDGLGHFRQTVTSADFGSTPARTTYTHFNPNSGTYPPYGSFTLPSLGAPWVLTTYDFQTQTEGGVTARQESCFETYTGFLQKVRTLTTGTSRGATDQLAVLTRDSQGNRIREQYYGGDTQAIGTGDQCDPGFTLPSPDSFRIDHGYERGSLRISRYWDSQDNVPFSYYTVDRNIDANTGLPSAVFSASTGTKDQGDYVEGVRTNLTFDSSSRLSWEKPTSGNGAWVQYTYTNANGSTPARVTVRQRANGSESGTILAGREYEYDSQGRLAKEKQLLSGQSWPASGACTTQCNQRITAYTGMGLKDWVSEWQLYNPSTVYKTQYLNYDPFGRPGIIRPPDGTAHDITFAYTGVRKIDRTVMVTTAQGSETAALTSEEYDGHGRLWKVTEKSGSGDTDVGTTYGYDAGSRLKQASTTASGTTQVRNFNYDNRGLLTSEQLPELAGGSVTYSDYDARGHAGRAQDGAHDIRLCYDRAERVGRVLYAPSQCSDPTPTNVLKSLVYATSNNGAEKNNGKLVSATSHNPDLSSATVVETYTYAGVAGRTSTRRTVVEGRQLDQTFSWNDLGLLRWQTYPNDTQLDDLAEPVRTIINTYSNGFLTGVCHGSTPPTCSTNYITGISYHANRMVNQITHANGTKVVHGKDPVDMARPASISLQRTADSVNFWLTGTYAYDGAENVKAVGSDWYTYDKVSRIKVGTTSGATKRECATYTAFGTVNGLGTGTSTCSPSAISVDAATNRMSSPVTYDAAGNMTLWSGNGYIWNRLNQLLTTTGTGINRSYAYTVDGERALDRNNLDSTRTLWIRDLSGKVLREYSRTGGGSWSWSKDYVYRNGLHVASVTSSATRHFALDHLGSLRRGTTTDATPVLDASLTRDFYPFGREATSATSTERMQFTGHQRDTYGTAAKTDDLDYMHARYYNPNIARFLSVDPGRDNNLQVPQSWNLYAYVRNNPISKTDPDGRITMFFGALIGGGAEYGIQVVTNLAAGSGFRSFADVDGRKIAASAALGAVTSGLTGLKIAGQGLSLGTRALIAAASNLGEAQAHAAIDGEPLSPLQAGTSLVTGGGSESGGAAGQELARSLATGAVKKLEDTARRLANIAADGRARPAQAGRAAAAASRAAEYGAGTVAQTAQEVARKAVDEALEKRDQ